MRGVLLLSLTLGLVYGCGSDGVTNPPGPGHLTAAQALVQEIAHESLQDAEWVFGHSHASDLGSGDRGYAHSLIGVDEGALGVVTLADLPLGFVGEPYCSEAGEPSSPFWETRDRCLRIRVDESGVTLLDVYFTMKPHTEAEDRHPFSYGVESPAGTITYDPNPMVTWRVPVATLSGELAATAELDRSLTFNSPDGASLDLSHRGAVGAFPERGPADDLDQLTLEFPGLGSGAAPVRLEVVVSAQVTARGAVVRGTDTLAVIGGSQGTLTFDWRQPL